MSEQHVLSLSDRVRVRDGAQTGVVTALGTDVGGPIVRITWTEEAVEMEGWFDQSDIEPVIDDEALTEVFPNMAMAAFSDTLRGYAVGLDTGRQYEDGVLARLTPNQRTQWANALRWAARLAENTE